MKKLSALILALVLTVDTHAAACLDEVHIVLPIPRGAVESGRILGACEAGVERVILYNFKVAGDQKTIDCAEFLARLVRYTDVFALAPPPSRTSVP